MFLSLLYIFYDFAHKETQRLFNYGLMFEMMLGQNHSVFPISHTVAGWHFHFSDRIVCTTMVLKDIGAF